MTVIEFDHGYWYAKDLKEFAKLIGIPGSHKLRKDELERSIRHFLESGKVITDNIIQPVKTGVKDSQTGLSFTCKVEHYTNDKETWNFIQSEALKIHPNLPKKSGAKYWLNRWREEQEIAHNQITYGELVSKWIDLNLQEGKFPRIPSARFINFMAAFLEYEKNSTRTEALAAWKMLKSLDIAKTYQDWKKYHKE